MAFAQLRTVTNFLGETAPFRWFQPQGVHQILLLGPEGSGKTSLLYKLKIPGWRSSDMTRELAGMKEASACAAGIKDPAYHYEEFVSNPLPRYGVWDVPGCETFQRIWPMFYRFIRVSAVLFVVDNFSSVRDNMDRLFQARDQLHTLLNEDELRAAAVVVVLNVAWPEGVLPSEQEVDREEAIFNVLGLPELRAEVPQARRIFRTTLNCTTVTPDSLKWQTILKDIKLVCQYT